ncbi:MAG: hypothetical protein ACR2IP_07780 [Solirubrobacteraceae bacterium]
MIAWHHSRIPKGLLDDLNSLIQAAKRRARRYRTNRNFVTMIYLIVGKLQRRTRHRMTHPKCRGAI